MVGHLHSVRPQGSNPSREEVSWERKGGGRERKQHSAGYRRPSGLAAREKEVEVLSLRAPSRWKELQAATCIHSLHFPTSKLLIGSLQVLVLQTGLPASGDKL